MNRDQLFLPREDACAAAQLAPLTLAFVGDAVYELLLRTRIVQEADRIPKDLQKASSRLAKAAAQAKMAAGLRSLLTEEEEAIFLRGRNTNIHTMAKHATLAEYRAATGLEALFGFLYLSGRKERLLALVEEGVAIVEGKAAES